MHQNEGEWSKWARFKKCVCFFMPCCFSPILIVCFTSIFLSMQLNNHYHPQKFCVLKRRSHTTRLKNKPTKNCKFFFSFNIWISDTFLKCFLRKLSQNLSKNSSYESIKYRISICNIEHRVMLIIFFLSPINKINFKTQ